MGEQYVLSMTLLASKHERTPDWIRVLATVIAVAIIADNFGSVLWTPPA